jgi:hypothetical protein
MILGLVLKQRRRLCFVIRLSELLVLSASPNFALTVPCLPFEEAVMIFFGQALRSELTSLKI